jgi:hypothetical protein
MSSSSTGAEKKEIEKKEQTDISKDNCAPKLHN